MVRRSHRKDKNVGFVLQLFVSALIQRRTERDGPPPCFYPFLTVKRRSVPGGRVGSFFYFCC
jgi:hypothetical protein